MFLEYFDFIYSWLFGGGLPNFLTVDTANWIAFGVSSSFILLGIIFIMFPLFWFINKIFRW